MTPQTRTRAVTGGKREGWRVEEGNGCGVGRWKLMVFTGDGGGGGGGGLPLGGGGGGVGSCRRINIFTDSNLLVLLVFHPFDLFTWSVVWDLFIWS